MKTIDQQIAVPTELALQLEGLAITAEVSVEEYLRAILEKYGPKMYVSEKRQKLREYIREQNAQGVSDSQIARDTGLPQQTISNNRKAMKLPAVPRVAWNKGRKCVRLSEPTQ